MALCSLYAFAEKSIGVPDVGAHHRATMVSMTGRLNTQSNSDGRSGVSFGTDVSEAVAIAFVF